MPARILIVDDHLIARTSIRSLLDGHGFRICGEAKIIFLAGHDVPAFRNATEGLSDAFVSKYQAETELIPILKRLSETSDGNKPRRLKSRRAAST
jgi:CheY-like chemotaxis protein